MPTEVEDFLSEGADLVVTSKWQIFDHVRFCNEFIKSRVCTLLIHAEPMKMNKLKRILNCFSSKDDYKAIRKKIRRLLLED